LLKLLGQIRKRAGKVRDLDVQLAALRSLKMPREPRRKRQEKKLRKAVEEETVQEIRKRLKRASKNFKPEAGSDPLAVARGMLDRIGRVDAQVTEALLHQYRILSKRARYAAEFAEPSAEGKRFITEIKRMQDALGDWHDWFTLTHTASENLGEVRDSPLVAELHNVTGAKFRHAVAVLSQFRGARGPARPASAQATAKSRLTTSAA
jgi:CHAD domain-containing protein